MSADDDPAQHAPHEVPAAMGGCELCDRASTGPGTLAHVGAVVLAGRLRRGWSQRALARAVGTGHAKISRIETGAAPQLTTDDLLALSMALQIPPAVLTGWADHHGHLAPPPPDTVGELPAELAGEVPSYRVRGPAASSPPPRIGGRLYLRADVHRLICPEHPDRAIPGHPRVRACHSCGCAVEPSTRTSHTPQISRAGTGRSDT